MTSDRISPNGLYLKEGGQSFALPAGYSLDLAERLVVAYGDDSLQTQVVDLLGWPSDTSLQWVWQDGFVLSDSGEVSLEAWNGEDAMTLDVVEYDENGTRRTYAGREAEVAGSDFDFGSWSLGDPAVERKSRKLGFGESYTWSQLRGGKSYELSDHLGNVAVEVGDRRIAVDGNADFAVDFFEGEVVSARDFYPFGMVMPERSFSTQAYRYGFNGKEFDSEWKGIGNSYDTYFRQYSPRLGRWLSIDPKIAAFESPYVGIGNSPILFSDPKGDSTILWPRIDTQFGSDFQRDLQLLVRGGRYGTSLIKDLANHEIEIKVTTANHLLFWGSWDVMQSNTKGSPVAPHRPDRGVVYVEYAQRREFELDGVMMYSFLVLAHEFVHARDIANEYGHSLYMRARAGEIDLKKVTGDETKTVREVHEVRAMIYTNMIRKENGIQELRTDYDGERLLKEDGITPIKEYGFDIMEGLFQDDCYYDYESK